MKAIVVGTFDPFTIGHEYLVNYASKNYDEVVVGIGINPDKTTLFSMEERAEMIKKVVSKYNNVTVESYDTLTIEFAKKVGASIIIKGVRNKIDLEYEMRQACYNKKIDPSITTKFVKADPKLSIISSTYIKLLSKEHKEYLIYIPDEIKDTVKEKLETI